jgi:dTDP-4-amino-4,6-dideoxygalactose transaminase
MVTTHSEELAHAMKILCLHGISRDAWNRYSDKGNWYYQVLEPGFKYNLSDVHAAIGVHQLRKLDRFIDIRTRYARLYHEMLAGVEELELPADRADSRHSWHLYTVRLNTDKLAISRDDVITLLRDRGVGTSVHFIPVPLHPAYAELSRRAENRCPAAMALYPRLISLPLYPAMSEGQVEYVADTLAEILRAHRNRAMVVVAESAGR